jgi:hypothetical protein
MMKTHTTIYLLLLLALIASCAQEDTFDGPSLEDLYGDFSIARGLEVSDDSVDFLASGQILITAKIAKNVQWKLEITGMESAAKKIVEGFSSQISYAWDGTTTELPMFRSESCAIALTFENQVDTLRDTVWVIEPKATEGFILADFETGINPGWAPFVQSGANMSFNVQTNAQAAQGNRYYDMGGQVTWDWLIGLVDIPASAYGVAAFPLSENASQVYFNTLLYKPASINNGLILFRFSEDENGDGIYNAASEDQYSYQMSPTMNGWSVVSQRYDQLQALVNGNPSDPAGNGLHEPHKLIQVSVLFLANPGSGYSQAYLDYMTFTNGSPVRP